MFKTTLQNDNFEQDEDETACNLNTQACAREIKKTQGLIY